MVKLLDVVSQTGETNLERMLLSQQTGNVYMVFEFCDHDLTGLLEDNVPMSDPQVIYTPPTGITASASQPVDWSTVLCVVAYRLSII